MPNQIKRLFAFDFDDTLAITSSIIGVKRTTPNGKSDPDFINWLLDNNLSFQDIEGEKKTFLKIDDRVIKIKIKECIHLIGNTNIKGKHTANVLKLMRFQHFYLQQKQKNMTKI